MCAGLVLVLVKSTNRLSLHFHLILSILKIQGLQKSFIIAESNSHNTHGCGYMTLLAQSVMRMAANM